MLHLKYRPKTFDEIVGNNQLKKALMSIDYESPIMFEGMTGCGKSSLSYIIAMEYGANPWTIREINCGYYTKIEDMRKEIDDLGKSSLFGEKKVLILSEVHKLSQASQNAWLIPLENLSKSVFVIGNTTVTDNIINTFMDRFVRLRVKPLTQKESLILLNRICKAENIELPKWLQMLLIDKADGIPRRLLNSLSKVRNIKDEEEAKFLLDAGILEEEGEVIELFKLLLAKAPWKSIKKNLSSLLKEHSPESIRVGLMNIISGRIMSDYSKEKELTNLSIAFDFLRSAYAIPEKGNLIWGIYKVHSIL